MEWFLLWIMPSIVSLIISLLVNRISIFVLVLLFWGTALGITYLEYTDRYNDWIQENCRGDHPWFEWRLCRQAHKYIMSEYNPKTYCKINFESLHKYFQVNPERYELRRGYVAFDNEDDDVELRMVVPRRELRKYFKFRRDYLQSRQMVNVLNFVQGDINKMREDAQSYLDKAKEMLNQDFGNELSGRGG